MNFLSRRDVLALILIGVIVFLLSLYFYRQRESGRYRRSLLYGAMAAYLYLIIAITILGRPYEGSPQANLIPLWEWYHVIAGISRWYYVKEIALNIILFIPLAFLAGLAWKITAWRGFLYGLLLSAVIELIQLASCRGYFDWDDMLHNAIGCLIGVLIANGIRKKGKDAEN